MSLAGRKPTADRSQVRFKGSVAEWTEVEDIPFADPPAMPEREVSEMTLAFVADNGVIPGGWPGRTEQWWRAISRMPHCKLWTETDWQFAMDTMETHARFIEGWKGASGSELRQREKLMGVYYDARRDLRIRYVEPRSKKPAATSPSEATGTDGTVTDISSYRNL